MKKALSLFVAAVFTFTASAGFVETKDLPKSSAAPSPLQYAEGLYSDMDSASELFYYLKVDLSEKDNLYIDSILPKVQGLALPKLRIEGQLIFFDSLPKPITAIDVSKRIYAYNGKRFDLTLKKGLEATFAELRPIFLEEETASWWDFLIPRVHADIDPDQLLTTLGGAVGVGGLAMGGACMFNGGKDCGGSFAMSGIGFLGMFIGMKRAKDKKEKRRIAKLKRKRIYTCTDKGEITITDGLGKRILIRRSPAYNRAGQAQQAPLVLPPYNPNIPLATQQAASSRFVGICDNAAQTASLNAGLQAPPAVLPPVYKAPDSNSVPATGFTEDI